MGPPAISLPENCQRNGEDGIAGLCHRVGLGEVQGIVTGIQKVVCY